MERDREEIIAELRRLAALAKDAERERKLLALAERLEAGDAAAMEEIEHLPLEPR